MLFDDLQSIQSGLSGFGSEIVQFQKALAEVEQGYSLFLLDEFARGTNPDEGAIIVQAVTRYLNDVNAISLLTTHYDKVAEHARIHYQIIGLRDVDPEQIRRELAATNEDGVAVIGISDFAQDALGDVVFVNLPGEGDDVTAGEAFGDVESVKAVSDLVCPVTGAVCAVNEELLDQPELLNKKPYDAWIIKVENITDTEELLDAAAYEAFCAEEG